VFRELALFAGAGGGLYASILLGWRTVAAVEIDPYARSVLRARQDDGIFEPFELHDDVRTFDGRPWRGHVDIVTGGFPCQDISVAGRGAGLDGARSGLWSEYRRIVAEVEPSLVFAENSPYLASRGLDRILRDLAALGFDAEWSTLSAGQLGAPHRRDRLWIFAAHPDRQGELQQTRPVTEVGRRAGDGASEDHAGPWWAAEPGLGRMVYGVAHQGDRIRALGNGQIPLVAAVAALELARRLGVEIG
jgi:DNA (cytosine-5)-methyltransferase 1